MSFAMLVDRVRADFERTPQLEVSVPQGVRLWNLGADDCRFVVDALVDAGFLQWTARRTLVRTGLEVGWPSPFASHVRVARGNRSDRVVGKD